MAAEDTNDEAKPTPEFFTTLNRTTLENLEKIITDDPAVDLWLHLREQSRKYKAKRDEVTEKPKPPEPSDSDANVPRKNFLPVDGNLDVPFPLSPKLANLLGDSCANVNASHQPSSRCPSRTALFELLENGEWIHRLWSRAVVKITADIVVKICKSDGMVDLLNIEHVRAHSSIYKIPTPEPLGMLQNKNWFHLFMSFIPGISLENIWRKLDSEQKARVRQQLNAIFSNLRRLPLPSKDGYLGAGDPLRCKDTRRWIRESSSVVKDEHEFNDFLLSEHHVKTAQVELIRPTFPAGHRIVMTHGDLHPRNILVDNDDNLQITGIIDWEAGGGYPEYWEYVKALQTGFDNEAPDWYQFLPEDGIGRHTEDYARDLVVDRMVN